MTEKDWLACTDPEAMLEFLGNNGTERKMRLFACACCRGVWKWLEDASSRIAVEAAEEYADDTTTDAELSAAGESSLDAMADAAGDSESAALGHTKWHAANSVVCCTRIPLTWDLANYGSQLARQAESCYLFETANEGVEVYPEPEPSDGAAHAALLRCIFGNPFHSVAIDAGTLAWNDAAVVTLAQAIYGERELPSGRLDAGRLAALANALDAAGCTNAEVLSHCRQPTNHVRGCWVVDRILGKK